MLLLLQVFILSTELKPASDYCDIPYCVKCDSNNNYCVECTSNAILEEGRCIRCQVANCEKCSSDYNICETCDYYYGLVIENGINTGKCERCLNYGCYHCYSNNKICTECRSGYGFVFENGVNTGKCQSCWDVNCYYCDSNNQICTRCKNGYQLKEGKCNKCQVEFCQKCSENVNFCTSCDDNYGIVIENGVNTRKCEKCIDINCDRCDSNNKICTSCKDNYSLEVVNGVETGKCTQCQDENCKKCSDIPNFCISCRYGYGLVIENGVNTGKCERCLDNSCYKCYSDNKICTDCSPGYGVVIENGKNTGKCEKCLDNGCRLCYSDNKICTDCSSNYGLVIENGEITGKCEKCMDPNCYYCDSNYKICTSCIGGYTLEIKNGVKTGKCLKCEVENCNLCPGNVYECTSCFYNYGFVIENGVNTGKCARCLDKNCDNCKSNNKYCSECDYGYGFLIENGVYTGRCQECEENNCSRCDEYNSKYCHSCYSGYGFVIENDINMRMCRKCGSGCIDCKDNYKICNLCQNYHGLVFENGELTGECRRCGSGCINCTDNYEICNLCDEGLAFEVIDGELTGNCSSCPDNCKKCNFTDKCDQCYDGYGFEVEDGIITGNCSSCPDHCEKCNFSDKCDQCIQGYGLEEEDGIMTGNCSSCPDYCEKCNFSDKCDQCIQGYGLELEDGEPTGNCTLCPDHCESCEFYDECDQCIQGYGLEVIDGNTTGNCSACPNFCLSCRFSNKCDQCYSEYGFEIEDGELTGKCRPCTDHCKYCEYSPNCNRCYDGYGIIAEEGELTGNCSLCSIDNCMNCDNDTENCNICYNHYGLIMNNETDSFECLKCTEPNCLSCNYDIDNCTQCERGFEYVNGTRKCFTCYEGCIDCSSSKQTCYECKEGYLYEYINNRMTGRCYNPCKVENCSVCISGHTDLCSRCDEGFKLTRDYQCVEPFDIIIKPTPKPYRVYIDYNNVNDEIYTHNFDKDRDINKDEQIILDLTKNETFDENISTIIITNKKNKNIAIEIPQGYTTLTFKVEENSFQKFDIIPLIENITIFLESSTFASIRGGQGEITIESSSDDDDYLKLNEVQPYSDDFELITKSDLIIELIEFTDQNSSITIKSDNFSSIEVRNVKIYQKIQGTLNGEGNFVNITRKIFFALSSKFIVNKNVSFEGCEIEFPTLQLFEDNSFIEGEKINGVPRLITTKDRQRNQFLSIEFRLLLVETQERFYCSGWGDNIEKDKYKLYECDYKYSDDTYQLYAKKEEIQVVKKKKKLSGGAIAAIVISVAIFAFILIFLIIYFGFVRERIHNSSEYEDNEKRIEWEKEKERRREMERERQRQKAIEKERQKEIKRERQRQKEAEKERQRVEREQQRQREIEQQQEIERERQRQREIEQQQEIERERQRQREIERQQEIEREKQRQREIEQQQEIEREKQRQREIERQQEIEREKQRQREIERQQEIEREKQRQREIERQQEIEREKQRQRKIERQKEIEREKQRQREIEQQKEIKREKQRQREIERQKEIEREKQRQREIELEKERQADIERKKQERIQAKRQGQLQKEILLKIDQIDTTISGIPEYVDISSIILTKDKIVESMEQMLLIISSKQIFLNATIFTIEVFNESIFVINTVLEIYIKSLNKISSYTDPQNLVDIINMDISKLSRRLTIYISNVNEITNNLAILNRSKAQNTREIKLLMNQLSLECVLFKLSVDVHPQTDSPFFRSNYTRIYNFYNKINDIQEPIIFIKSFCGSGKTNFIPLFLTSRSFKENLQSPFIILTQTSSSHVSKVEQFYKSSVSSYVTIISTIDQFYEIYSEYEQNHYCVKTTILAVMTSSCLLQLMQRIGYNQMFYQSTRIIIDEIHQRTFHNDVLISKISEMHVKYGVFKIPMNIVIMSSTISQEIMNPFQRTVNTFTLIKKSQFEIIEKPSIFEPSIYTINNETVRDETVKVIYRMSKINNQSSIERGHILCFLSNTNICFNVNNSVLSILSTCKETSYRKKIVFLQTQPKMNESKESFFIRLRKEYKLKEKIRELEGYEFNFFYIISFVFSGNTNDLISDLVFNEFPEDLRNITKLIYTTQLSESYNFQNLSVVIDSGLVEETRFDSNIELTTIVETQASKESMFLRRARLGRSMIGNYISINSNVNIPDFQIPEIERINLTLNVLMMKRININIERMITFSDENENRNINFALDKLKYFDAINRKTLRITQFGEEISNFPFISFYYAVTFIRLSRKFSEKDKDIAYIVIGFISTIISMSNVLIKDEMTEKLSRFFCEDSDVTTLYNALSFLLKSRFNNRENVESYGFSYTSFLQLKENLQKIVDVSFPGNTVTQILNNKNISIFVNKYKGITSIIDKFVREIEYSYPYIHDIHCIKFKEVKGACDFESKPTLIFDASESFLYRKKSEQKGEIEINKRPGWNGITIPLECYCFNININSSSRINHGYLIHRNPKNPTIAITSIEVDQIAINPWFNTLLEIYCDDEIQQCTPFLNNEQSLSEKEIFHFSSIGSRMFVSFIPNKDGIKGKISRGIEQCLLIMPFTPRSLLIYQNELETLVEVRNTRTQNYETFIADEFHGEFLDKKKIDFCVQNIGKLNRTAPDIRICALFSKETCHIEDYDQTHLFLINENNRSMPLILNVIRRYVLRQNIEEKKIRHLSTLPKNQLLQKNNDLDLFAFPPEFIHPALIHHKQSRSCILRWFSNHCYYANVVGVVGHKFLMKKNEILELQRHIRYKSHEILEEMKMNYVAIQVPPNVYKVANEDIEQQSTWTYDEEFEVIIAKKEEENNVNEFLEEIQADLSLDDQTESSIFSHTLNGKALCCLFTCDDPDNPVFTSFPMTLYFKDGSTYTGRVCRDCIIESIHYSINKYFHDGQIDDLAVEKIKSKPKSITTFSSRPIINGQEICPQIPIGQFVSILINNDTELSIMISAWLEIVAEYTIQKQ